MTRPSRNVDELLLKAGRELFPAEGCAGMSVRKVAERAGVNLGMFHYHFRTKDAFVRQLLQGIYDEMFSTLEVAAGAPDKPLEGLRQALKVLAHFARDQHRMLGRLLADAMDGRPVAREFLAANVPRHATVILGLIAAGQRQGALRPVALPQAAAFVAGAVGAPLLVVGAVVVGGLAPPGLAAGIEAHVCSDAAIAERIDLALAALSTEVPR